MSLEQRNQNLVSEQNNPKPGVIVITVETPPKPTVVTQPVVETPKDSSKFKLGQMPGAPQPKKEIVYEDDYSDH